MPVEIALVSRLWMILVAWGRKLSVDKMAALVPTTVTTSNAIAPISSGAASE